MKSKLLFPLILATAITGSAYAEEVTLEKELNPKLSSEQIEIRAYKHEDGATITEYKSAGKVWMIKVEPGHGFPAYYLYDDEGHGQFQKRIMGNTPPSPPMWIIKKF